MPATLAEYDLDAWDNLDFYDVSMVDGSNLPMYINQLGGRVAALAHRLDRMIDDRVLCQAAGGEVDHGHLEHAVALLDPVDVRGRRAAVRGLVGRGLDLRFGWKRDGEGIVRIAVFLPGLRKGGAARDERRQDKNDPTHVNDFLDHVRDF